MSFAQPVVRSASVLGQAHTPHRRFLPFAAIAVLMLAAPAVGGADPSHTASSLRAQDTQLAAKSRAAVLGLYSLDQQLSVAQARLATLHARTVSLHGEQTSLAYQLSIARRGAVVAERRLGARLRLLYEQGNVEPLEIVFGAKSLDEALTSLDNMSRVSGQSEDVLRQLKSARAHILAAQRLLADRRAALAQATAQAGATANSLAQTRSARAAYISSLASQRRLNQHQIAALVAEALAAHQRSEALARSTAADTSAAVTFSPAAATAVQSDPATPSAAAAGGRTITVTATGYALGGRTASGLNAGWGVAAVDPSLIPLGSHMTVPGYGEAVAADTGSAVVGATIDLWFPTIAQANAWGRRTVTVVIH
jgi:3D (Asp-Asp-Asp) domain-containing protein